MIIFLLLTGPVTYLMRACGLLLVRTRLMPRQMSSGMALASTAVLAALVAPSLLRPAGHLAANPLNNPRLLVALLVLPLILALRRNVQAVLSGTVLSGMGLLWALSWLAGVALPVSVPLTLLLLAGVSLAPSSPTPGRLRRAPARPGPPCHRDRDANRVPAAPVSRTGSLRSVRLPPAGVGPLLRSMWPSATSTHWRDTPAAPGRLRRAGARRNTPHLRDRAAD
jgi:branched-subunit amino acid transport protein